MSTQLEHANLCVSNIDGMIKFLQTALPDFVIRHDETILMAIGGYILAMIKLTLL